MGTGCKKTCPEACRSRGQADGRVLLRLGSRAWISEWKESSLQAQRAGGLSSHSAPLEWGRQPESAHACSLS